MTIHWTPGIGDPTPVGWFTVLAYLATAFICVVAGRSPKPELSRGVSDRFFWLGVGATFLFLALNKQLDLQSLLTEIARAAAKSGGWYGNHRPYQAASVVLIGIVGLVIMLAAIWQFRARGQPLKLALCGVGLICTFVVLRAASFHHVDLWLGSEVAGLRLNWLIELSGIAIVALAALWSCMSRQQ